MPIARKTSFWGRLAALTLKATALLAFSASAAQAISISNVRLSSNGQCGNTSATQFLIYVVGSPGEFPDQDRLVDFGGGNTQWYDNHHWYVIDPNGIIIGTTWGNNFGTNTGVAGDSFFSITQRPSATGNVTVALQDEAGDFAAQSVGGTYVAGSTQRASLAINAAALDPDCVPLATDTTAPVITGPSSVTVSLDPGQSTKVVTYTVSANDDVDGAITPTRTAGPASGSAFPVGMTTVTHTATDTAGNTATASFIVTITDDEAPVITVPADITVSLDAGQSTKVVDYTVSANDNVDGTITPTRTAGPASGSAFSVGTTTVTHTATDTAGNTATESFTVTVTDDEAPVFTSFLVQFSDTTEPGQNYRTLNSPVDLVSFYSVVDNVTASNNVTINFSIGATPLTGPYQFPVGSTDVTVIAVDEAGNESLPRTTRVLITDAEAPVITVPADITVEAGPGGTQSVTFAAKATDNVDGALPVTFSIGSGPIQSPYAFPTGTTTVTASATDTANNAGTNTFDVTVTPAIAPATPLITTADINANRSLTIGGTAEADSTVRVTFPDGSFQEVTATGGTYNVTSSADMQGGTTTVYATDAAGNQSGSATVDLFPDYTRPTVSITGAPAQVTDTTPFNITITFSETVLNFVSGDISITGGTVTGFSGTEAVYTAEITPIAGIDQIEISIAEGVAQDEATNDNFASNVVLIDNIALTETEQMIVDQSGAKAQALRSAQPNLGRLMRNRGAGVATRGSADIYVTQGAGNFDFSTAGGRNVWAEGQGRWSTEGTMESGYAHLSFGAHYDVSETLLVGAMLQADTYVSEDGDMTYASTGYLIGPYAVARLANHPLIFSASYLIGQSDNTLSPFGTYEDSFASDRSVATLGVMGELNLGTVTLMPVLDLVQVVEESEAYVDGDSNPVDALKVTTTDGTIGVDFEMPLATDNGALQLTGGIGYTASRYEDPVETIENTFGQISLGFSYAMESGGRLTASATYDGLGNDDYEAVNGSIMYEMSF